VFGTDNRVYVGESKDLGKRCKLALRLGWKVRFWKYPGLTKKELSWKEQKHTAQMRAAGFIVVSNTYIECGMRGGSKTAEGRRKQGQAARKNWKDPRIRRRMVAGLAKGRETQRRECVK